MQTFWRMLVLAAVALGALTVLPGRAAAQNAVAPKSDDYFNFFELNAYGGWGDYAKQRGQPFSQLEQGGLAGARTTENFWNYFALEQDFGFFSYHRLVFRDNTPGGVPLPVFGTHVYQGSFNGVLHFTPRDSKFRPFVTAGVGEANYVPNAAAVRFAQDLPSSAGFTSFGSQGGLEVNYGGGLKYQLSRRFGVRMDARGYYGHTPQFGIPSTEIDGNATIPRGFRNFGVQLTGGLTMYFGHIGEREAPPAPAPPPPVAPHNVSAGSITASATSVCPGDTVRLHSDASDPNGHTLSYQWSVDGSNQGGNSADYNFTPSSSGDFRIGVHVSDTAGDHPAGAVDAGSISIHVGVYNPPTAGGLTANPDALDLGQTATLHVNATGSECGGALRYSWAASEGTATGSSADAQYNSTGVSFNQSDRSRPQSKQVTVTATVTDSKGGSASASTNITVNLAAAITHFGDIVFPKGSARVNNCGKRVLIEQLYPMLTANANFDVVLVGHIDTGEVPKSRHSKVGRDLDKERVLQTAAVLSGGTGTCAALDTSRIKGVWVGATQDTPTLPTSCTISTTAPKERKGAEINPDEAKNRRVEIWLVPKGMELPPAARDAKELPAAEMKKIGCPK